MFDINNAPSEINKIYQIKAYNIIPSTKIYRYHNYCKSNSNINQQFRVELQFKKQSKPELLPQILWDKVQQGIFSIRYPVVAITILG